MPVAGAIAYIVTTAERAKTLRKPPVYLLGAGVSQGYDNHWYMPDMTVTPTVYSAPQAYAMAGYGAKDMQFAEFYDCYTILVSLLPGGRRHLIPKGEVGPFFETTDTTYKGTFPINTDGGQLSAGQLNGIGASGCQQLVETVRQIRGEAGERQVARHDLCDRQHERRHALAGSDGGAGQRRPPCKTRTGHTALHLREPEA